MRRIEEDCMCLHNFAGPLIPGHREGHRERGGACPIYCIRLRNMNASVYRERGERLSKMLYQTENHERIFAENEALLARVQRSEVCWSGLGLGHYC